MPEPALIFAKPAPESLRAWVAIVSNVLVPGLGFAYCGHRALGVAMFVFASTLVFGAFSVALSVGVCVV